MRPHPGAARAGGTNDAAGDRSRRRRPIVVATVLVLATVVLAGCADEYGSAVAPPEARVEIGDGGFSPATIEVAVNQTVMWVHTGSTVHTVESMDGAPVAFASLDLEPGDRFVFTPPQSGTYPYRSSHGDRPTGEIVVR